MKPRLNAKTQSKFKPRKREIWPLGKYLLGTCHFL